MTSCRTSLNETGAQEELEHKELVNGCVKIMKFVVCVMQYSATHN
jgi:hypothetical protein